MDEILVEDVPDGIGRGAVIVRLVARALAGRDHLEAAGARPVDMLADQRRLVAPGQAVDDARGLGLAREQRTRDRVGLDIDHDDVLAVVDRRQRMADAGRRDAGRLDDHLDLGKGDQGLRIGGDMGASGLERFAERCRRDRLLVPAGVRSWLKRARNVEIGDGHDVQSARAPRLRQKHGAEFAGPDQPDGHRPAGGLAFKQHGMEIHGSLDLAAPLGEGNAAPGSIRDRHAPARGKRSHSIRAAIGTPRA